MTTTAQSVIKAVQTILVDLAGLRWPATDLVVDLNAMQRAIQSVRPDSTATSATITCAGGVLQALPATAASLIEFKNLTAGTKAAVRQAAREMLDALDPEWRNAAQTAAIEHYIYDRRHPRIFEVYPPALNGTQIDGTVSAYPTDVAAPGGAAYSTVTGNISLADEFAVALVHLVCYRAYMKDADYASNAMLAKTHLDMAVQMVGSELESAVGISPKVQEDQSGA